MEKIEVRYSPLANNYYHKYLVYTNNDGVQFYARGGPENDSLIDWIGSDGTDWGRLVTEYGIYGPSSIDWDAEGDDPVELLASGTDLSDAWAQVTAAFDALEAENHLYDPFGANSNAAVDAVLFRLTGGAIQPQQDDLLENWAPGSGGQLLGTAENQFVEYSGDLGELVGNLLRADPRMAVAATGASYTGANSASSVFYNLHQGDVILPYGVLLTSGDGTPATSNTSSGYGLGLGEEGDPDLTTIVAAVFPEDPETFDATVLNFQLNILSSSINTILVDVIFGSDEYPEYADSYVDIGAVIVNGTNVAYFNNDPQKPLSVLQRNVDIGVFRDNANGNIPIEYDGISEKLTISAPVHFGLNTIKVAIADTGDPILDSGLFVSNLRPSEFINSGVKIRIDAGTDIDLDNLLETLGGDLEEYFVGGAGNDTIFAGGGEDLLEGGAGEDDMHAGDANDEILGGEGNDRAFGEAGADTLNGGSGLDSLEGGDGNDTYYVDSLLDVVTEIPNEVSLSAIAGDAGAGVDQAVLDGFVDTVVAAINYSLQNVANVENLTVDAASTASSATGNALDNVITGNALGNALSGAGGNDTLDGGAGNDTAVYSGARADYSIPGATNGTVTGSEGTDTLISIERYQFSDLTLAFDLGPDQAAGNTVKVIGAAFDAPTIGQHPDYVGIGLDLFDSGMSLLEVCQLVIGVMGNPSNVAFVNTVYQNLVGAPPSQGELDSYVGLLQGSGGPLTQAQLLEIATLSTINAENIDLVGLQASGVEFA